MSADTGAPLGEYPPGMDAVYKDGRLLAERMLAHADIVPQHRRSGVHAVLGAADAVGAEVDALREKADRLQTRVDELEDLAENLHADLARVNGIVERVRGERDDWRAKALA